MSQKRLRPSPSRSYLWIGAVLLLGLIGLILLWRALTGTTMKDQRSLASQSKSAQELQSLPPTNPESLSAKLEAARQQAEEQQKKVQPQGPSAQALPLPAPVAVPGAQLPTPSPSGVGQPVPSTSQRTSAPVLVDAFPSDSELDAYERRKTMQSEPAPRPPASSLIAPGMTRHAKEISAAEADLARLTGGLANTGPVQAQGATGSSSALAQQIARMLEGQAGRGSTPAPADGSGDFRRQLASQTATQAPLRLQPPAGPARYLIMEGTSIPVVLEVDVSSDIKGRCTARVAQDVLDSTSLSYTLIPAGSRLVCTYDDQVVQGQNKLLLAFTRLILPDGSSVPIADMDAADRYGAVGAPAQVNSRFWSIFGSSFLIAAVTRLAEPKPVNAGGITINTGAANSGASTAASVLAETSRKVLERNLNIKPELRLNAGDLLRLTVTRDILIEPYTQTSR